MDYQKKAFEVEISNGGPRGYETAITLKLPATWAEFHDALQKARIPDGRNCGIELTRSWWAGLSSELIGGAQNLYELNLFAMRLTMLTSVELLSMDGLLKMEQARGTKSIPIPRLINLTFNADCHILPDVFNDESLGAFLYENEMLTKEAMCLLDTTEPGSGYHGRLLEVFGEEHRQTIGGVFTSCGYMESNGESFEEVYRPGQMAYFDRSGSPVVLEVTMGRFDDPAYDSDKSIFLNLPAVGNAIGQAIDKVGANSEKECGFQCVECLIPSLREMINDAIADAGGLAPAEKMATLLKQKQRIWNEDAIIKYKAILEASGCSGLQDAIRLMEDLDQYELRPDVAQPWGYAELVLREKYPDLPEALFQTGQSAEIGRELLEDRNGVITEYGLIRRLDGQPVQSLHEAPEQNGMEIKDRLSEANRNWQRGAYIPQDGTNRYFAVDTALICMDQFISQVRDAYKQLELLGPEHCESGSYEKLDYEGRVLVLAPDTLKESYWNQRSQLWLAHDGFGCTPGAIGRSIRCTCLGDGEETRWNRTDFIGVLKEECLPQWAAEALSKLTEGKEQSHTQGGMTMQ